MSEPVIITTLTKQPSKTYTATEVAQLLGERDGFRKRAEELAEMVRRMACHHQMSLLNEAATGAALQEALIERDTLRAEVDRLLVELGRETKYGVV